MSAGYQPILWNRQKKIYDIILVAFILAYVIGFFVINKLRFPIYNDATLLIRSFGTLALFLLHVILSIGPLSRIDRRFLPLLYNRRHLGVTMFLCATVHAVYSLIWFHAYGNIHPLLSLFLSNTHYGSFIFFPFQTLGFAAYIILMLMAFTSHDFWLNTLSPRIWKSLHMLVYVAYALLVLHVALGVIQLETSPILFGCLMLGLVWLCTVHLLAAWKERMKDHAEKIRSDAFIYAGRIQDIPESRALVVNAGNERAAIFRYDGKLSAMSNVCKHQNGPLGEGKIVDGCITCPWHGYQYLPHNGCAPPPFTEKIATYKLKLEGDSIYIHPDALPEGTAIEPLVVPAQSMQASADSFYIGWQAKTDVFFSKYLKRVVPFIAITGLLFLVLFSIQQRHIANAAIDTSAPLELQGQLLLKPFPMLRTVSGKDAHGNPVVKSYPLVNAGKSGADNLLKELLGEKESGWASVKAYPIIREGIAALTLIEEPDALMLLNHPVEGIGDGNETNLGSATLMGEIIDPKCYLGTMNPGEGKPHRDCAIRCIAGGIMPMCVFTDSAGVKQFAVIRAENGEPVNQEVLFAVAEPVSIRGKLTRFDNWLVLYANPKEITRLYYLSDR